MVDQASKRVALVTGANKGIGFEIARQLGKAGLSVFLGSRDKHRGDDAASSLSNEGLDVSALGLDLASADSIRDAARNIESAFGRLDVLVNNAGIVDPADGPPSVTNVEAVRRIMETNFFNTITVTQAMLPLLRQAPAARIVNVSSGLGSLTLHGDPGWMFAGVKVLGYCASKAALNMLTVQLAYELRDTNIKVNSADPGFTATDLSQHRGHQTVAEGAAEAVRLALLPPDGPTGGFFQTSGPNPW